MAIRVINPQAFIDANKELNNGKLAPSISAEDFEITWEKTEPTEGYIPKGENNYILRKAQKLMNDFPNCCEAHKKLLKVDWFDKSHYEHVPNHVLNTFSYTIYHISQRINTEDWYKDIIDYIEYSIKSYGQLPIGYGSPVGVTIYLYEVQIFITLNIEIPKEKKIKLLEYLKNRYKEDEKFDKGKVPDLNILMEMYKKWLNIFPFDLSIFRHLKEHFEKRMPVLEPDIQYNRYTKLSEAKMLSEKALTDFLIKTTEEILTHINSLELYEKGKINDVQKLHLEIINSNRRLEIKEMGRQLKDKPRFIVILKKWFNGEEKYLTKLRQALVLAPEQPPAKPKQSFDELLNEIKDLNNTFCQNMPISIPIEHFKVFVDQQSKNGKPYLSKDQFALFIRRAFGGQRNIQKLTFNHDNREKLLIVKRFYEFYNIGASNYENTTQCKYKYIKLVCDNFTNWSEKQLKDNFGNKVNKDW